MYQDLMIAALVNIGLIGIKSWSLPIQIVNFLLSVGFLILSIGALVVVSIMICWRKYPQRINEFFASLRKARMPILMHVLLFGITRFVMALLIAIGNKIPSAVSAFVFSFLCLLSIGIQLPFRIYQSPWMNIINILMEIQNFILSLLCIICEVGALTYDTNRTFGFAMIIIVIAT